MQELELHRKRDLTCAERQGQGDLPRRGEVKGSAAGAAGAGGAGGGGSAAAAMANAWMAVANCWAVAASMVPHCD